MFTVVLWVIAKTQEASKYLATGHWLNKSDYFNTMAYCAAFENNAKEGFLYKKKIITM